MPWFHVQLLHATRCNNCTIVQELHAIIANETTALERHIERSRYIESRFWKQFGPKPVLYIYWAVYIKTKDHPSCAELADRVWRHQPEFFHVQHPGRPGKSPCPSADPYTLKTWRNIHTAHISSHLISSYPTSSELDVERVRYVLQFSLLQFSSDEMRWREKRSVIWTLLNTVTS